MTNRYKLRGVSSDKEDVHNAIKKYDKGLYPKAFCKILPDLISNSDDHALIIHSDGAGTKSSLAYIYWKETGDNSVWKDIAQDSIVMNLDDVACVGAIDNIVISSTIGRNKNKIPGAIQITAFDNNGNFFPDFFEKYKENIQIGEKVIFISQNGDISSIRANGFVEQLNQLNIYHLKDGVSGLEKINFDFE